MGITVIYYLDLFFFHFFFQSVFYIDVHVYISDVRAICRFSFNMLSSVIFGYIGAGY